mmetsp:Transcript_79761/g.140719  ORF Transcript_79761/g.140719 Transcript_79761/m.140719 type:complete len:226 (+) Transcript_79761:837-1514(+)
MWIPEGLAPLPLCRSWHGGPAAVPRGSGAEHEHGIPPTRDQTVTAWDPGADGGSDPGGPHVLSGSSDELRQHHHHDGLLCPPSTTGKQFRTGACRTSWDGGGHHLRAAVAPHHPAIFDGAVDVRPEHYLLLGPIHLRGLHRGGLLGPSKQSRRLGLALHGAGSGSCPHCSGALISECHAATPNFPRHARLAMDGEVQLFASVHPVLRHLRWGADCSVPMHPSSSL